MNNNAAALNVSANLGNILKDRERTISNLAAINTIVKTYLNEKPSHDPKHIAKKNALKTLFDKTETTYVQAIDNGQDRNDVNKLLRTDLKHAIEATIDHQAHKKLGSLTRSIAAQGLVKIYAQFTGGYEGLKDIDGGSV